VAARPRTLLGWIFRDDDTRAWPARLRSLGAQTASWYRLPRPVARFYLRALFEARRLRDKYTFDVAIRPRDLQSLLTVAEGRRRVAEFGTATGWTALALALTDPQRTVVTYDPVVRPERERYLQLVDESVRARITFVQAAAESAPRPPEPVDLVFDDASHEHDATVASFRLWRDRLATDGVVAFHDYGDPAYPGVAQAIATLGLRGSVDGALFVWRRS
jgi:predicted O-methyltransferase YrrM